MHDFSDNRYLIESESKAFDNTANSFLFQEIISQKEVDIEKLFLDLYKMHLRLRFNMHYSGFPFLVKLVQIYIVDENYNYSNAISRVAYLYGTDEGRVLANIKYSIDVNKSFIGDASMLLRIKIAQSDAEDIPSVVEILGAIFKLYYNYVVVGDTETEADKNPLRDISKVFARET